MPTPFEIGFEANGEQSVKRAWETVAKGCEDAIRSLAKLTPESNKAEAAQRSLGQTSEKWVKALQTPFDAHLKRLSELQALRQNNTLTEAKYAEGIALSVKMMKEEEAAADKLGQAAKRVLSDQVTAQEVFNARLGELNVLRDNNLLTEQQYATAVAKARAELEAQDGTLKRIKADTDAAAASQAELNNLGSRIRSSLATPTSEYKKALDEANRALNAGEISEAEYAMAVDLARKNLDAQDQSLQANLRDAARIKSQAVPPQEQYATAIRKADELLKKNLITKKEYNAELIKQNELLKKAEAGESSFFETALSNTGAVLATVTGVGTVIAGVAAVAAQLRAEYDNLVNRQKSAADRQIDTAAAQHAAIAALGDDQDLNADQLTQEVLKISLDKQISPKVAFDAAAGGLSARAKLSSKEALDALSVAAEANPYSGVSETTQSLLDLKNRFGGDQVNKTTMPQLMGVLLGGQQASRVKDSTAFATQSIPAITQLGAFKDSLQSSTALVAAMSSSMNDAMGSTSGTAAVKLAKQLEIALPKLPDTMSRIKFVQSEEGNSLRKKFFSPGPGKMDIEAGAYKAVQELLSPGENSTKGNLEAALKAVPTTDTSESVFRKITQNQKSQAIQRVASVDRQYKVEEEAAQLSDAGGAAAGVNREGLLKFLKAMRASDVEQKYALAEFEIGTGLGERDPLEYAVKKLREKASAAAADKYEINYDESGQSGASGYRSATAQERLDAQQYSSAADRLSRLQNARGVRPDDPVAAQPVPLAAEAADRVVAALEKNTAATVENTNRPPVAKGPKPINKPTKPPASAALAAAGGR